MSLCLSVIIIRQNVALKTPLVTGTTTEVVLSTLSGVYMSLRLSVDRFCSATIVQDWIVRNRGQNVGKGPWAPTEHPWPTFVLVCFHRNMVLELRATDRNTARIVKWTNIAGLGLYMEFVDKK